MKILCNVIQEGGQVCFTLPCLFDGQSFKVEAVAKSQCRVFMFHSMMSQITDKMMSQLTRYENFV